jgi:rhomboid protease GluP
MSPGGEAEGAVPAAETSAAYLVKRVCAGQGYTLGAVPEADKLALASDFILTKADGLSLQIVCVIDRERDPSRRFRLSLDEVVAVGKACVQYSGRVNLTRLPVAIQVWDVGPKVAVRSELSRRLPGREKVMVSSWALDSEKGRVTSTVAGNGLLAGRRFLEDVLREPRRSDAELKPQAPRTPVVIAAPGPPKVTYGLLALMLAVFVAELLCGLRPRTGLLRPDVTTLVGLGGLLPSSVDQGEWWRLFTAAFLHVDAIHLLLNAVAFYLGGVVLERLLGRIWMVALFIIGALAGAAFSYLLSPPNVVSVGASGAILAILGAAFVVTFRLPGGMDRLRLQVSLLGVLAPTLVPLVVKRTGGQVDFAAHLGGAAAGVLVGLWLLRGWPASRALPGWRRVAWMVTAAGWCLLVTGVFMVVEDRGEYVQAAQVAASQALLVPPDEIAAANYSDMIDEAPDLVARYPHDPRARLFNAARLDRQGNLTAAARELSLALAEREILLTHFSDRALEADLRSYLAELLVAQGKDPEARAALAPVCHAGPNGTMPEPVAKIGLCK